MDFKLLKKMITLLCFAGVEMYPYLYLLSSVFGPELMPPALPELRWLSFFLFQPGRRHSTLFFSSVITWIR
ncbi:MAG: hypothetical protein C0390_08020 [Syntrophus sp. (in: bacteria)]|nr:hypothetical protein [Syntrophus sp. (in: bacteria)]